MTQGTMLQYFHRYLPSDGNLWKQIKEEAQRLKDLGFSTIWFPPACKGTGGGYSEGYDIYDLYDLGEFTKKARCAQIRNERGRNIWRRSMRCTKRYARHG